MGLTQRWGRPLVGFWKVNWVTMQTGETLPLLNTIHFSGVGYIPLRLSSYRPVGPWVALSEGLPWLLDSGMQTRYFSFPSMNSSKVMSPSLVMNKRQIIHTCASQSTQCVPREWHDTVWEKSNIRSLLTLWKAGSWLLEKVRKRRWGNSREDCAEKILMKCREGTLICSRFILLLW